MAKLYGSMQGGRGQVTRTGTRSSGIQAHLRGWNFGVYTRVDIDPKTDEEVVLVYLTSGSNKTSRNQLVGEYTRKDYEAKFQNQSGGENI